jgi:hypothetical protein
MAQSRSVRVTPIPNTIGFWKGKYVELELKTEKKINPGAKWRVRKGN